MINAIRNIKSDKIIFIIAMILGICFFMLLGIELLGNSYNEATEISYYKFGRYSVFILIGLVILYFSYRLHYLKLARFASLLFMVTIPLLMLSLFCQNNDQYISLVSIPVVGMVFETSYLARITLILFIARALSRNQGALNNFRLMYMPIIMPVLMTCMLLAPVDLGATVLLFFTCLTMMSVGRVSKKYILLTLIILVLSFCILVLLNAAFPGEIRILENFYKANYLEFASTDFIEIILKEKNRLMGAGLVGGLLLTIVSRCRRMIRLSPKTFGGILAFGLSINIFMHSVVSFILWMKTVCLEGRSSISNNLNGSSILFTFIALGIVLNISRYFKAAQVQRNKYHNNKKRASIFSITYLKYFIPLRYREEIIGDMYELRENMNKDGYSKASITFVLMSRIMLIMFAMLRVKLSDLINVEDKKKLINR